MYFPQLNTRRYLLIWGDGACIYEKKWRGGYGRIIGGLRVLEVAADIHEAAPGKNARYSSTSLLSVEHSHGRAARHHKHEEWHVGKSGEV
jgi:hypothetical protein